MCKMNMSKNSFVMANMGKILDCLTRGLPLPTDEAAPVVGEGQFERSYQVETLNLKLKSKFEVRHATFNLLSTLKF